MNTAKLQIFADDIDSPPQLSRSIPAALEGLIDYQKFQEFADQIDELLLWLDFEHQRLKSRSKCWEYGVYSIYPALFFLGSFGFLVYGAIWISCMLIGRCYFSYCKKSPKSIDEIVKEIRLLCETMTNHTPHVSFHPMFRTLPPGYPTMDVAEHIDVSISNDAFAKVFSGAAVLRID